MSRRCWSSAGHAEASPYWIDRVLAACWALCAGRWAQNLRGSGRTVVSGAVLRCRHRQDRGIELGGSATKMGLTDEYERETGEGGVGGEEGRSAFGGMMRRGRGMVYLLRRPAAKAGDSTAERRRKVRECARGRNVGQGVSRLCDAGWSGGFRASSDQRRAGMGTNARAKRSW